MDLVRLTSFYETLYEKHATIKSPPSTQPGNF